MSLKKLKIRNIQLWDDHFYLTRQLVVDATYNLPCLSVDREALDDNQRLLGRNFARMTDRKNAGQQLTTQLLEHIEIAVQIVVAALAGNSLEVSRLYQLWVENGKDIACTFHTFHKEIEYCKMKDMMLEHLESTFNEAVVIISKDCAASRRKGEIALAHVREMVTYINSTFC